jgi:hypothetical protein
MLPVTFQDPAGAPAAAATELVVTATNMVIATLIRPATAITARP